MIYDIFTYNSERDILDIRFNVLYPHVDKFVIIEFDETFSGKPKRKLFIEDWNADWVKFIDKIEYAYIVKPDYRKYEILADSSPNVPKNGPNHWKQEFCQKESIKDVLFDLEDDDVVFIGDVDEIWDPNVDISGPHKLKLKVYSYYLDNRSSEVFYGPIVAQYKDIKDKVLNHLRTNDLPKTEKEAGWHFTSIGGAEKVKQKLTDSYTNDSYATHDVLERLTDNIDNNRDFLWRDFSYWRDESEWPQYLKDNKLRYRHLLKY